MRGLKSTYHTFSKPVSETLPLYNPRSFHARKPDSAQQVDARCQLEIGIVGKSTSASWYEIWEAASALAAMCIRAHEKGGKAFGIGDYTLTASLQLMLEKLIRVNRPPQEHICPSLGRESRSESVGCKCRQCLQFCCLARS